MSRPLYGYKTHHYCSLCGQGDGWYDKTKFTRCPIHGYRLRKSARFTKIKREERWASAY